MLQKANQKNGLPNFEEIFQLTYEFQYSKTDRQTSINLKSRSKSTVNTNRNLSTCTVLVTY